MTPEKWNELRGERAALVQEARDILEAAEDESRELTKDERADFDRLQGEIDNRGKDIDRWSQQFANDSAMSEPDQRKTKPLKPGTGPGYPDSRRGNRNKSEAAQVEWRDLSGNRVAQLSPHDSLYEYRASNGAISTSKEDRQLCIGKYVRGILTGKWDDAELEQRAAAGGQSTVGGYLLTPSIGSIFVDLARARSSVIAAGASTIDMGANSEVVLARLTADPSAQWAGENQALTDGTPTFGSVTFRAKKLVIDVFASREIVHDSLNASDIIRDSMTAKAGLEIDRVALLGAAASSEPVGLFNATDVVAQGSVGSLDFADYLDAIKSVEDNNGVPSAYLQTPTQKNALAALLINAEANHYATAPADVAALNRQVTTQLANSQSCVGDFSQLLIGVNSDITIEAAPPVTSTNDQWRIRLYWRGDIQFAHANHLVAMTGIS